MLVEVFVRCMLILIRRRAAGNNNFLNRNMLNVVVLALGQAPIQRTITTYDVLANVRRPGAVAVLEWHCTK